MNSIKISLVALVFTNAIYCMHTEVNKSLALQLEEHPAARTSFLWRYAIAEFCDIDEKGVYYNGIQSSDSDITFTLSWAQVKKVLNKAYQDLADFDVSKRNAGLNEDYRKALKLIQRNLDPSFYEATKIAEARTRYHAAWTSGDILQIKEVLKANHELWPPHIA